jgi:hypothetical protein
LGGVLDEDTSRKNRNGKDVSDCDVDRDVVFVKQLESLRYVIVPEVD